MAEPRDVELRLNIDRTLAVRLDALVQAKKLNSRADLLLPLIQAMVTQEIHEAMVLLRIAGINPSDPLPGGPDGR
jgi:metal-responsive CopG/Arc/MetJ family transcriptional regulator